MDESTADALMAATGALVGVAARSLAEVSDQVTLAQLRVLVLVDGRDDVSMGELARTLGVIPSTASRLCGALEAKGLVERRPAPHNRRVVGVHLTAAGRRIVRRALARRRRLLEGALERLSPAAQVCLRRSLAQLTEALGEVGEHAWQFGWPPRRQAPPSS